MASHSTVVVFTGRLLFSSCSPLFSFPITKWNAPRPPSRCFNLGWPWLYSTASPSRSFCFLNSESIFWVFCSLDYTFSYTCYVLPLCFLRRYTPPFPREWEWNRAYVTESTQSATISMRWLRNTLRARLTISFIHLRGKQSCGQYEKFISSLASTVQCGVAHCIFSFSTQYR